MAAPEDSDGISLGSEDSATSSSEHQSSEKAEGSTSFRNASEGGTGCLEGSESVLNDGYLTDNRYVHKDGREETWYQQKHWTTINPGPRGPPAAFLPGPLFEDQEDEEDEGPSCAEDHFPEPVPVVGEETEIAVAMTKVNDEAEAGAGAECTCASSSLARIYDDAPYFDHENGKSCGPLSPCCADAERSSQAGGLTRAQTIPSDRRSSSRRPLPKTQQTDASASGKVLSTTQATSPTTTPRSLSAARSLFPAATSITPSQALSTIHQSSLWALASSNRSFIPRKSHPLP